MKAKQEQKFFLITALLTFFFILTAQTFWSTIHGDGAVYAYLIKQISKSGFFLTELPNWNVTEKFAEHPYLFFIFGSWFTKLFGYSDLAVKLPNYFITAVTISFLYLLSKKRNVEQHRAAAIGVLTGYVLFFNPTYLHQVSQPTLDPLAQLLALISVFFILSDKNYFISGIIIGLAFLTKGLELLPNLGAICLVIIFQNYKMPGELTKKLLKFVSATIFIILLWLAYDRLILHGEWLRTYWYRQFESRFFMKSNMQSVFDLGFLKTFVSLYFIEIILFSVGLFRLSKSKKIFPLIKNDFLWSYFLAYTVLNLIAFLLIKKDSSQHMTGIILTGSLLLAELLYDLFANLQIKKIKITAACILVVSFIYWSRYMINRNENPDIWTAVKVTADEINQKNSDLPIVIKKTDGQYYGVFYTSLWYLNSKKVYTFEESQSLLVGKEVITIEVTPEQTVKYLIEKL